MDVVGQDRRGTIIRDRTLRRLARSRAIAVIRGVTTNEAQILLGGIASEKLVLPDLAGLPRAR